MSRRRNVLIGVALVGLLVAMAAIAVIWTPYDPLEVRIQDRLRPPSFAHWLGTDEFGRDVLSRTLAGAAFSVFIALVTSAIALVTGTLLGVVAGYKGGWVDRVMMALNDTLLAFPGILLALGLIALLETGVSSLVIALAVAFTPGVVRVVRSSALSIRHAAYIEASRLMGNSETYTMLRHVLPNCAGPVVVLATSMLGWALLSESALSFLGLGVAPPTPTWGNMLATSRPFFESAPWLSIVPGACITLGLLGLNLLGDGIRDEFDPRMDGQ